MNLAKAILEGDRLALARLLTRVENDDPRGREALVNSSPTPAKHIWWASQDRRVRENPRSPTNWRRYFENPLTGHRKQL